MTDVTIIYRRCFEAANHPPGSLLREKFNRKARTSAFFPSHRYVAEVPQFMSDGTRNEVQPFFAVTFRTLGEARADYPGAALMLDYGLDE